MNSLPCWPPSLLLLWGLEDMFNILLYSSSSPLIQPQPQVPAALWLLMARDERRGTKNPLIMTSTPLLRHCCCCISCAHSAQAMIHVQFVCCFGVSTVFILLCQATMQHQISVESFIPVNFYVLFQKKCCIQYICSLLKTHFQDTLLLIVMCSFSYCTCYVL